MVRMRVPAHAASACGRLARRRSVAGATLSLGLAAGLGMHFGYSRGSSANAETAWTAAMPLGRQSTAKDVVEKYAPERRLKGTVALVTGGNSGIGVETVKALSLAGCRVILASRSVAAGREAVEKEVRVPGLGGYSVEDADVEVRQLDLADLSSVVRFADEVRASGTRIDYLVLNAGVMALPNLERTASGFERQIGVNHFGHALLVRLLRPILENQDFPSRVVTVSSTAHNIPRTFDVGNLNFEGDSGYSAWGAYGNSKLANALFAKGLAKRLPGDGRITSVSLHPGVIRTPLWRSTPASGGIGAWLLDRILTDKTVPQGAATTLYACLSPKVAEPGLGGAYLSDCNVAELSKLGKDPALAESLWKETDKELDEALARLGLSPDGARSRKEEPTTA